MSIIVNDICFSYNHNTSYEKKVLKHISFSIKKNDFVLICGENGSGKSTLIKHFNGLIKPNSGSVKVNGVLAHKKEIKSKMGMLFQYPNKQLFAKTVYEEVAFSPSNFGIKGNSLIKHVSEALELVGFSSDMNNISPFSLSGGQTRLLAIASIIAVKPEYVVFDEPFSGLDQDNTLQILSTIKKLHASGMTIIIISHEISHLLPLTTKILILEDGEIIFDVDKEYFLQSDVPNLPPITLFMKKMSSMGLPVKNNIYKIEDAAAEIIKLKLRNRNE